MALGGRRSQSDSEGGNQSLGGGNCPTPQALPKWRLWLPMHLFIFLPQKSKIGVHECNKKDIVADFFVFKHLWNHYVQTQLRKQNRKQCIFWRLSSECISGTISFCKSKATTAKEEKYLEEDAARKDTDFSNPGTNHLDTETVNTSLNQRVDPVFLPWLSLTKSHLATAWCFHLGVKGLPTS